MNSGAYLIIIKLKRKRILRIGRLGRVSFKKGYYIYTGSAMKGLISRVKRHRRRSKKMKWHIDFLLRHSEIIDVLIVPSKKRIECKLNRIVLSMDGAEIPIRGFGSSDCRSRCASHLVYFRCRPKVLDVIPSMV